MLLRRSLIITTAVLSSTAIFVSLAGSGGCVHDRPPPEPVVDAPKIDALQDSQRELPPVTVLKDGVDVAANLECQTKPRVVPPVNDGGVEAGADGAVPPGSLVEKQVELIGFGTGGADKLSNQTIDIFYNNSPKGTPDQTVTSDDKGMLTAWLPEGVRIAYHVRASSKLSDYYGLDDLHYPVPIPGSMDMRIRWQGVTLERREFFSLALTGDKNWQPKPGNGMTAGRVMDCERRYVQYAEIVMKDYTDDAAGKVLEWGKCGEGLCRVFLTDSELPDVGRTYTSRSALFTILDVPVNRKLRLIALGMSADGKTKIEVAHRDLELVENAITTQFLEPDSPRKF